MANRGLVRASQAPSAALRPLLQPLYDTEMIPSNGGIANLVLFARPVGQAFQSAVATGARAKTLADTNMVLGGQLGTPQEFDLFGFNCQLVDNLLAGITRVDFLNASGLGVFQFQFGQGRPYLQTRLKDIPAGCDEYRSSVDGAGALDSAQTSGLPSVKEVYNFAVKRQPVHIYPQEAFSVTVGWPVAAALPLTDDLRLTVYLRGILYASL